MSSIDGIGIASEYVPSCGRLTLIVVESGLPVTLNACAPIQ